MTSLSADGLAIGYGGRAIASGLSFAAEAGEVLVLLGPNGCGKTTLFKTLLGLLPAVRGTVALGGAPLTGLSRREIARRVAYVPQSHGVPFAFSALELVTMGRTAWLGPLAQPGRTDRAAAQAALERVGIAHLAGADVTHLSGGQRQLVFVARALAQEAPVLVLDEPTASLDFGNQAVVLAEIARLSGMGLTIVLSTHDPDHAFAVGTRALLMEGGAIAAQGPPAETLTETALSRVYGVGVTVERLADGRRVCVPSLSRAAAGSSPTGGAPPRR
ncbi:ABC transporter ATP-binding protein [Acuticoccus sediminis]|uniref:ABC transporter ATP-binding protein n=1 Tax=Acuticoccus sediminis TaxID=2184697 RepID=UPI001CFE66E1|nr:ABC transporter ATP-binding protein [Acuticoccus sediminis]